MDYYIIKYYENDKLLNKGTNNAIHFAQPDNLKQPTIGYGYDIEQNGFNAVDLNSKAGATIITAEQMARLKYLYQKTNRTAAETNELLNLSESITITRAQADTLFEAKIVDYVTSIIPL